MIFFGFVFILYFIKLSVGNGFKKTLDEMNAENNKKGLKQH